jgi:5-methylcytosine-specific restriction endonuclease McrA
VVHRALQDLVSGLKKRKFGATDKPRRNSERTSKNPRHIPAHVRREVAVRDGGQCTYVSDSGHRCTERKFVEFDHVVEVARGGMATVANVRLRCRVHNQYAAERTFGAEFMRTKREEAKAAAREQAAHARSAATEARAQVKAPAAEACDRARAAAAEAKAIAAAIQEKARGVVPFLEHLGYRATEARRAAVLCEKIPDASLGDRMRLALSYFRLKTTLMVE